jgi:hypothetical protein
VSSLLHGAFVLVAIFTLDLQRQAWKFAFALIAIFNRKNMSFQWELRDTQHQYGDSPDNLLVGDKWMHQSKKNYSLAHITIRAYLGQMYLSLGDYIVEVN